MANQHRPFGLTDAELRKLRTRNKLPGNFTDHHLINLMSSLAVVLRERCGCVCPGCRADNHCCMSPCKVNYNEGLANSDRLPPNTHDPVTGLQL